MFLKILNHDTVMLKILYVYNIMVFIEKNVLGILITHNELDYFV
jgi:hypothetical protein